MSFPLKAKNSDSDMKQPTFLLGLSGGADSIYLFHYFLRKGISFHAAHFNHGWRDDAADDAAFCKKLCTQHHIPFHLGFAADYEKRIPAHHQKNNSPEARARAQRRAFLEHTMRKNKLDGIALAHHRDDQAGTLLLRLIRGSTLAGLGGMYEQRGIYHRPLLRLNKADIVTYLHTHNLEYREDKSNRDKRFLRNRINAQLLPALHSCDNRALHNITRSMQALREENDFLIDLVTDLYTNLIDEDSMLPLPTLRQLHPVLLRRLLLHFLVAHNASFTPSEGLLTEMIRFVLHERGGSHTIGEELVLVKKGTFLSLQSN